jgi:hypothetical protein
MANKQEKKEIEYKEMSIETRIFITLMVLMNLSMIYAIFDYEKIANTMTLFTKILVSSWLLLVIVFWLSCIDYSFLKRRKNV